MTYDKNYFITKFEAIPDKKWFVGDYHNKSKTKYCALGHCESDELGTTFESRALSHLLNGCASEINDGLCGYDSYGKTPKQRILHALKMLPD